jgi:hypothetical protein
VDRLRAAVDQIKTGTRIVNIPYKGAGDAGLASHLKKTGAFTLRSAVHPFVLS